MRKFILIMISIFTCFFIAYLNYYSCIQTKQIIFIDFLIKQIPYLKDLFLNNKKCKAKKFYYRNETSLIQKMIKQKKNNVLIEKNIQEIKKNEKIRSKQQKSGVKPKCEVKIKSKQIKESTIKQKQNQKKNKKHEGIRQKLIKQNKQKQIKQKIRNTINEQKQQSANDRSIEQIKNATEIKSAQQQSPLRSVMNISQNNEQIEIQSNAVINQTIYNTTREDSQNQINQSKVIYQSANLSQVQSQNQGQSYRNIFKKNKIKKNKIKKKKIKSQFKKQKIIQFCLQLQLQTLIALQKNKEQKSNKEQRIKKKKTNKGFFYKIQMFINDFLINQQNLPIDKIEKKFIINSQQLQISIQPKDLQKSRIEQIEVKLQQQLSIILSNHIKVF